MGCGKLHEVAKRGGCQQGSTRSTVCIKMTFFKNDLGPHGMPKQAFSARGDPFWLSSYPKMPRTMAVLGQKGSKRGPKCVFPKNDPRPLGVHKQLK